MVWLIIGIILLVVLFIVIFGYKEVIGNLADRINELEEEIEESEDDYSDSKGVDLVIEKHQYNIPGKVAEKTKHVINQVTEKKQAVEKEWEVPVFPKKDK